VDPGRCLPAFPSPRGPSRARPRGCDILPWGLRRTQARAHRVISPFQAMARPATPGPVPLGAGHGRALGAGHGRALGAGHGRGKRKGLVVSDEPFIPHPLGRELVRIVRPPLPRPSERKGRSDAARTSIPTHCDRRARSGARTRSRGWGSRSGPAAALAVRHPLETTVQSDGAGTAPPTSRPEERRELTPGRRQRALGVFTLASGFSPRMWQITAGYAAWKRLPMRA
jgi:hypothetical protein